MTPAQSAARHAAVWQRTRLRDLRAGRSTWRLGIKSCGTCARTWTCDDCGKPFRCWNTWPFLWEIATKGKRGKRGGYLCRGCYRTRLEARL